MVYSKDFIKESIVEGASIGNHISFIQNVIEIYWISSKRQVFLNQLKYIKQRQNDKNMYMAVVGEFSTGKSSFINAIIKDSLLKTDILQATTSATTSIIYGDELDVKVTYQDGTIDEYLKNLSSGKKFWRNLFTPNQEKVKEEISEYIKIVTSEESISSCVKQVVIEHTSETLKNGLVIIDTPGTNAINKRHEEVTATAIKDLADAAIIIISADKQLPKTLIDFINNNLLDVLSKCIFVVNKMDLVRNKEQKRVLQYIESRIKLEFGVNNVNVYPYTPLAILKEQIPAIDFNCDSEYTQFLLEQSVDTEKKIYELLKQQRVLIQLQKLILLIRYLYEDLEKDLYELQENYEVRHKALEDNQIRDLNNFISEQKKLHQGKILEKCITTRKDINSNIYKAKVALLREIYSKIFGKTDHAQLKSYMKKELEITINIYINALSKNLSIIMNKVKLTAQKQKEIFEEDFKTLYNNLSTLGGNLEINKEALRVYANNLISASVTRDFVDMKKSMNTEDNKLGSIALGGAGAGALLGTVLFPGIGTAVGAIIGSLAGLLFKKPLEDLKYDYYTQIKNTMDECFIKVEKTVDVLYKETIRRIISEFNRNIDNYFVKYEYLVKEMIKRDELEKQELESKSIQIKKDLHELSNRKVSLENIREKIENM